LREEVRRIILPIAAVSGIPKPEGLLDVRRHEHRLAFVTDHAGTYSQQLATAGINHDVVELSLDEIFEAFVIGRTMDWPDKPVSQAAISV
jgi:ABC-2 type transport system ATP-binding protein